MAETVEGLKSIIEVLANCFDQLENLIVETRTKQQVLAESFKELQDRLNQVVALIKALEEEMDSQCFIGKGNKDQRIYTKSKIWQKFLVANSAFGSAFCSPQEISSDLYGYHKIVERGSFKRRVRTDNWIARATTSGRPNQQAIQLAKI